MRPQPLIMAALLATLLFPSQAWSQRTGVPSRPGVIRGQLRMPDGRMAPFGITVILIHREGDEVSEVQTDSSGKFDFRQVQPAIYRIKVHLRGYRDIESDDLDVNLSPTFYLNLELKADPNYKNPFAAAPPGGVISTETLNAPDEAKKALASGEELLEKGNDLSRSIELFKKAVNAYPRYSEAYLMMGLAYRAQADYGAADAALRKCIEINANSGAAYTALGEIQNERKDYAGAEKTLLKALALNADSPHAHVELARSYWAQKRYDEAEPHVVKALTLAPGNASAHLLMGNVNMHKRDGQAALQEFQQYLKLDPQGSMAPSVRDFVGKLQKALGQEPGQAQSKNQ